MNDQEKLLQQQEREQRKKDALLQRSLDKSCGIFFYEIKDVFMEANLRILQYKQQFKTFGGEFLANQTLQDFKRDWTVLQIRQSEKKSFKLNLPVAMLKDGTQIFLSKSMTFVKEK